MSFYSGSSIMYYEFYSRVFIYSRKDNSKAVEHFCQEIFLDKYLT